MYRIKSVFRGLTTLFILLLVGLLPIACGSGGGSGGSTFSIRGAGVKAPLAGATVRLYQVDLSQTDLKGALLDEGYTDSYAAVSGLTIQSNLSGMVLLEFVVDEDTVEINTNAAPVFDRLVTVFDVLRVYDNQPNYASPLTTMAVALAQRKADTPAPYAGNDDDVISAVEFSSALDLAQNQVKSTLGFGLDNTVDIFVVPPMLTEETDTTEEQIDVVRYRQAIEAVAAVANKIAQDSTSVDDSAQEIFTALAEDLSDGVIDGQGEEGPVDVLAALDTPIDNTLVNVDLNSLKIPGTDRPIGDIEVELVEETVSTGEDTDTEELENDTIDVDPEMPALVADSDGDGIGDYADAFPNDPTETVDTDLDGVGDNGDAFPDDATEWVDSDNDSVGDNADVFPDDPTETVDTDFDGVGDNGDAFPGDATEWADSDNDSVGDNTDAYPNDPTKVVATAAIIDAEAKPASATLTWADTGDLSYNLYYSTSPGCNIAGYTSCPGGAMVADVTSPYTVSSLTNGQNYWFQLESAADNGNAVSNEAGARPDQLVTNDAVYAIAHDANGTTYIGGDFTLVGISTGRGVPLSATTGRPGAFPQVDGTVEAAVSDGAGGYFIGGSFTTVGGLERNRLAHILADGTLGAWNPAADKTVSTLAVSGSTVYAGGNFTTIDDGKGMGAQTRNRLAAIDIDGTLSTTWTPAADNSVVTLAISAGTVYVGGTFTTIDDGKGMGAQTRNNLAAIGTNGTLSTTWIPDANNKVYALTASGSMVYAGGLFTSVDDGKGMGAQVRNCLAAIGTDGTLSTTWTPEANNVVLSLAVSNSTVYVGGIFTTIDDGKGGGSRTRNRLAAIGTDGTLSATWTPDADNFVLALRVSDGIVYAGGNFTAIDDGKGGGVQTRNYIGAIGTDGTLNNWNPNANDAVFALAVSGSNVYAGGWFSFVGGVTRNRLAAIDTDGTLGSWDPDADSRVNALAISGTTMYVGGEFSSLGGHTRNRLAAIGTDGTLSSTWAPDTDSQVLALAVSGTIVYAGGSFTSIDDGKGGGVQTRNRLAAIGTDGMLNTAWAPSADGVVYALAVSGSTVYVGGGFDLIDDGKGGGLQSRSHLAAIGTDGTLSTTWTPGASTFGVNALAVSGTTVYVGGSFRYISGKVRNYLAAIDSDGTLNSWNPDADGGVSALAVSGSTVYVGGEFSTIDDGMGGGAQTRNCLAAIGTDGVLAAWGPYVDGGYHTPNIDALAISGGTVYAGGDFHTVGGAYRPYFAELEP